MDKTLDNYLSLCTEVYDLSNPNPPEDAYAFYCFIKLINIDLNNLNSLKNH